MNQIQNFWSIMTLKDIFLGVLHSKLVYGIMMISLEMILLGRQLSILKTDTSVLNGRVLKINLSNIVKFIMKQVHKSRELSNAGLKSILPMTQIQ